MPTVTWIAPAAGNWSALANWNPDVPGAGADVVFADASSAFGCAVDAATAALASLAMATYTGTLTINSATTDVDSNGNVTIAGTVALGAANGDLYCAGNLTKTAGMAALPSGLRVTMDGTGTLTCNSVVGGTLQINSAGTVTLGDTQAWSDITLTAGTLVLAGKTILMGGMNFDAATVTITVSDYPLAMASIVGGTVYNITNTSTLPLDCSGGYTKDGGGNIGKFWFGSRASRQHPSAIRERSWGFAAGTRR